MNSCFNQSIKSFFFTTSFGEWPKRVSFNDLVAYDKDFPFVWDQHRWEGLKQFPYYWLGKFYEGDEFAGYALFYYPSEGTAELLRINVRKDLRRCGLGRQILEIFFNKLTELGAERVLLEVSPANVPAVGLYRDLNFELTGVRSNFYGPGKDAECYSRLL